MAEKDLEQLKPRFTPEWYHRELDKLLATADAAFREDSPDKPFFETFLKSFKYDLISVISIEPEDAERTIAEQLKKLRKLKNFILHLCQGNPLVLYKDDAFADIDLKSAKDLPKLAGDPRDQRLRSLAKSIFFTIEETGKLYRTLQNLAARGESFTAFAAEIFFKIDELLRKYKPQTEQEPVELAPPAQSVQKKNRWLPRLAMIAGMAAASFGLEGEQHDVVLKDIPPEAAEYILDVPQHEEDYIQAEPLSSWEKLEDGVYYEDDRVFTALPDGSWLHIPNPNLNKAINIPAGAEEYKEAVTLRYPMKAITKMGLRLEEDGYWHASDDTVYAVLTAGHLLKIGTNEQTFLPFGEEQWKPIAELQSYYELPYDLSEISTEVPDGYVDVKRHPQLQDIKCELGFDSKNNLVGRQLYPDNYPCLVPEAAVPDLVLVSQELAADPHHYHLGIGDAKRPVQAQQYLYDHLPRGQASRPDKNPPHVNGIAIDVALLDEHYLEVFPTSYELPDKKTRLGKQVHPPRNQAEAMALGWSTRYYEAWQLMVDTMRRHNFEIGREYWHFEYKL
jgi:D-alanyl-D-alanine dipeptidase